MSEDYVNNIKISGLSIYDDIRIGDPNYWIPGPELESLLNLRLVGLTLMGLPLRTRSKVVKERVSEALGYPIPGSFKRTHPRFPGQNFDVYVQKSNNLQIWNEELSPERRYILIRVTDDDVVSKIRVVAGDTLARLDTTGTLTQKYQASLILRDQLTELISEHDTEGLKRSTTLQSKGTATGCPTNYPNTNNLLPISEVFDRLSPLVGTQFEDLGFDQERNRGAALHRLVCESLGYRNYKDDGRFPDVRNQLIEVKLQTSPTIDLGLVCPDSESALDIPHINGYQVKHCDVRYAIFYANTDGKVVTLTNFFLTLGKHFFDRFPQFQGKVLNKKIQIPLPSDFFENDEL